MKLFSLVIGSALAVDFSQYPQEIYRCVPDENEAIPTTGKFIKGEPKMEGDKWVNHYYAHETDTSLVIYFDEQFQYWIMNWSLGADFAWYYMRSRDLFSTTTHWMAANPSTHVFGVNPVWTYPDDICEHAEKKGEPLDRCPLFPSRMLVGTNPSCACAVGFDTDQSDVENSIVFREGESENMRKVDGERWTNKISFLQVQPGCSFSGFNKPKFKQLIGKWGGRDGESHAMTKKQNNKISSYECSCVDPNEPDECAKEYFGGDGKGPDTGHSGQPCKTKQPLCDSSLFEYVDVWTENNKIGFVASVSVPEEAWDENGWTLAIRFNTDNFHGNLHIPSQQATQFSIFQKEGTGTEIVLQMNMHKDPNQVDLLLPFKFTIIGSNFPEMLTPTIFFWDDIETDRKCYGVDGNARSDPFRKAIQASQSVSKAEQARRVRIKPDGTILLKT